MGEQICHSCRSSPLLFPNGELKEEEEETNETNFNNDLKDAVLINNLSYIMQNKFLMC